MNLLVYWRHFWKKQLGPWYSIIKWQDSWPPEALGRLSRRAAWLFATHVCQREPNTVGDAIKNLIAAGNATIQSALKEALFNDFTEPRSALHRGVLIRIDWSSRSLLSDSPWLIQALCEVLMDAPQLPREEARLAVKLIRESGIKIPAETARKIAARAPDNGALWCLWAEIEPERAIEALARIEPGFKHNFLADAANLASQDPFWSVMARSDSIAIFYREIMCYGNGSALWLLLELVKTDNIAAKDSMRRHKFQSVLRAIRDNIANKPLPLGPLLPVIQTSLAAGSTPADFEVDGIGGLWKVQRSAQKGGQGIVWKVRDRNHNTYALKEVQLKTDSDKIRIGREIHALRQHQSRHLPELRGVSVNEERALLAMEWVDGKVVGDLDPGEIDDGLLAALASDIASALHELHQIPCIHRDVKPLNIIRKQLVDRVYFVLIDLGLSVHDGAERHSQSLVGTEVFLPPYYRPSRLESSIAIDAARDIYGLGSTVIWTGLNREQRGEFQSAWYDTRQDPSQDPSLLEPFALGLPGLSQIQQQLLARMVGKPERCPSLKEVMEVFSIKTDSSL